MKRDGSIFSVIAVCVIGLVVLLFIGLREKPVIVENTAIADTMESAAAESLDFEPAPSFPEVSAVIVDNQRIIMAADAGIYVKTISDDLAPERREPGARLTHLNAILPVGERRYAGGDGLFLLDDNYSFLIDEFDLGSRVYALMEFGEGILAGMDNGLWYHRDLPAEDGCPQDTLLKDGIIVTALAEDRNGLWVGTCGDGLYRFDGKEWQRRYLERDKSMFDIVCALEYSYPNLWVGTDKALFRYDGGKWAQMFVADSSEIYDVTCIMTTPAATYIGTTAGLLRYSQDTLVNETDYEDMEVIGLCRSEKGVLVATRYDGIFTYNGKEEIVSPEQLAPETLAGGDENEILAGVIPETYDVANTAEEYVGDTDY